MTALTKPNPKVRPRIGPYQLLAKIGEGGMGTVHLTKLDGPAGFNKLAVVKELRADLVGSSEFVEMFLNEARLAARLTHPNVVHTYGANEDDGRLYIAMEYLDGQPWSRVRHALWTNRSLPLAMHLKVLAETLAGLHYAHELTDYDGTPLQVVHCDMSPQNVFVTYDGQVKVVDFGVARAVIGRRKHGADLLIGKLSYIAPEQARNEEVDRRADIFSVGVMLWEALTGRRYADSQDRLVAHRRRVTGEEPRVRDVIPKVPRVLADMCDRALAFSPEDRFSTAAEFRDAILAYLAETSQQVDHAQLGRLVGNAFRDERAQVHALIERHLKRSAGQSEPVEDLVATTNVEAGEHTLKADLSEFASVSRLRDDAAVAQALVGANIRPFGRRRQLAVGGAAAAALLLAVVWLLRSRTPPEHVTVIALPTNRAPSVQAKAPAKAPGPTPSVNQAVSPSVPKVQLTISASPAEATIVVDGLPLRSNPFSEQVPSDGELHLIRASAPGLQSQERVIELDRDRSVEFKLARPAHASGHAQRSTQVAEPSNKASVAQVKVVPSSERNANAPNAAAGTDPARAGGQGTPAAAEPGFDTRLSSDSAARKIYEEDPY
jgi:serine/threonine-protein kinase